MKRLIAPLIALLALAVFPPAASAAVVQYSQTSCSAIYEQMGYPLPFICLAEDDDFGGNKLILTGSSDIANLGTTVHNPVGHCNPKTQFDSDNWNDCITSVWGKLGTTDSICLYQNSGFALRFKRWSTPSTPTGSITTIFDDDLGPTQGDTTSSIMLQQSGPQCS